MDEKNQQGQTQTWGTRLVLALAAIVVIGVVSKTAVQSWDSGDFLFVLFRWPMLFVGAFVVLVVVRLFFWKHIRPKARKSDL